MLASAAVNAQKSNLERIRPRTTTLVSQHTDNRKSVFNFQHGVRGDKRFPGQPGAVSLKNLPDNRGLETQNIGGSDSVQRPHDLFRTADNAAPLGRQDSLPEPPANRVRYDIRFGVISINGNDNWLDIGDRRGAQSVIKDLGPLEWDEVKEVPLLPASPEPYTGSFIQTRRGVVGPENVIVPRPKG
jgi:hypothetical protein